MEEDSHGSQVQGGFGASSNVRTISARKTDYTHQKEKIITVKYEKKTKAISPGTCDVHPHPTCTKSYQAALPSLGAALGLV